MDVIGFSKIHDPTKVEKYLKIHDLDFLNTLKKKLDDIYYNDGDVTVSDVNYDMLKDYLIKNDKKYIPVIGAKIKEMDNEEKLPFYLGSILKIVPDDMKPFNRWFEKNKSHEYVISDKLDGVSCLLYNKNGKMNLYTRGDGEVGKNITHTSNIKGGYRDTW